MHNKKLSKQKGFTLVEAMVTMIVIGVVGAIAIPSMTAIVRNQAISSVSNEIVATLQSARSEAIKRSTNVLVCFKRSRTEGNCRNIFGANTTNNDYIHVFIDTDGDRLRDNDETSLFVSNKLNEDVIFKRPTANVSTPIRSILFNSKGGVLVDNNANKTRTQIGICDDRNDDSVGRVIEISSTGRAQVTKISAASLISCT